MTKPCVVAIVGPTAVGKSALGIALARRFAAEIVSVDSRQVYRRMDIGTAKPTPEQLAQVPHHLIDVVEPTGDFSLALFLDLARAAIDGIISRGKLPLLVGGTGQYLRALLENWQVPHVPPDQGFRHDMEQLAREQGRGALVSRLERVDPGALQILDPGNPRRVIRALEVSRHVGSPWSKLRRRGLELYRSLVIALTLPREQLYQRIDERVDAMLESGWAEEVKHLLAEGLTLRHPSMASVGYRELAAYLEGKTTPDDAVQNIKYATHRFARHQYAWFRLKDPHIRWLDASDPGAAAGQAICLTQRSLKPASYGPGG